MKGAGFRGCAFLFKEHLSFCSQFKLVFTVGIVKVEIPGSGTNQFNLSGNNKTFRNMKVRNTAAQKRPIRMRDNAIHFGDCCFPGNYSFRIYNGPVKSDKYKSFK